MNQVKSHSRIDALSGKSDIYGTLRPKTDRPSAEQLQHDCSSPLGALLEKIAKMPEVRLEKVLYVRRQISTGKYKADEKLDSAVDNILEELLIDF